MLELQASLYLYMQALLYNTFRFYIQTYDVSTVPAKAVLFTTLDI
jgi:hypothetical protein